MEAHAVNPWVAVAYLIAGVCFILALRGLSSPATSRSGNRYGMIGMTIAVLTTLLTHVPVLGPPDPDLLVETWVFDKVTIVEILAAIAIGGFSA